MKPKRITIVSSSVGCEVRAVRRWRGDSQEWLAAFMCDLGFQWTQATVSRLERGGYACTVDELAGLAIALDVPIPRLLADVDQAS